MQKSLRAILSSCNFVPSCKNGVVHFCLRAILYTHAILSPRAILSARAILTPTQEIIALFEIYFNLNIVLFNIELKIVGH